MSRQRLKKVLDIYFIVSMMVAIYTVINIFITRSKLPPNVCPVENHNTLITISIVMSLGYFVLSVVIEANHKLTSKK